MYGRVKPQLILHDVGSFFNMSLPESSFYGQLAAARGRLFKDEDFAELYKDTNNGRPSVPPSQLALALIMQARDGISDAEAIERTAYDLRWNLVLQLGAGESLCAKSTLQVFRANLVLNDTAQAIFKKSVAEAKRVGLLKGEALSVATDTKPIDGRGAVEDTYNLLATGMGMLISALARKDGKDKQEWMLEFGLGRYLQTSVKGSADIDWSDKDAREGFLTPIVGDAHKLLEMANGQGPQVKDAADLLSKLLLQDVEEGASDDAPTATIKEGTAKGRIPSATDPEVRHGRKSKSKRFTGHKAAIVTELTSGIIIGLDTLAGDTADSTGALDLTKQAEETTGIRVKETLGDCAYGSGASRQEFEDDGRTLLARVPHENANKGMFTKSQFTIDLDAGTVTCPAGHTTNMVDEHADGSTTYYFDEFCGGCPLRAKCTSSKQGRSISVHPQERLLMKAREYQSTPEGKANLRKRVIVENALARLAHLGIGQARYKGHKKTRFQLAIACTIANLRRTWNWSLEQTANLNPDKGPVGLAGQQIQPATA
jgi:transposase